MNAKQDLVHRVFDAALEYAKAEAGTARVMTIPAITARGLETAHDAVLHQPDARTASNRLIARALAIPVVSRQRRITAVAARWIIGAPRAITDAERWFSVADVREIVAATNGVASSAEVVGYLLMGVILLGAKDQIKEVVRRKGHNVPW